MMMMLVFCYCIITLILIHSADSFSKISSNSKMFLSRRYVDVPVNIPIQQNMYNNDGLHDSHPVNIIAASDKSKIIKSISGPALLMAVALISPSIALADTNPDVVAITIVRPTLDVFVNVLSFLFLCRTIISWYPKTDLTKLPYSAAVWPTEPLLVPVRGLIPPAFGVDISAIVWIMLLQFVREITIGQQGILTLLENS